MNDFTQAQIDAWNEIEKSAKDSSSLPEKYRTLATTSDRIRAMLKDGYTRGAVAKALNIRYQFVRNVELRPLKKQA